MPSNSLQLKVCQGELSHSNQSQLLLPVLTAGSETSEGQKHKILDHSQAPASTWSEGGSQIWVLIWRCIALLMDLSDNIGQVIQAELRGRS